MRKNWMEPQIEVQQFMANEYVAACWKINCNVPSGVGFQDLNGNKKYDRGTDEYIASGYGCGEYHNGVPGVPDDGPVANAWWDPYNGDAYEVFYFSTGKGNNDQHFSKVKDAEWETNPNAS